MTRSIKELIPANNISERIDKMAEEISSYYGSDELLVLCILNGAMIFTSDLIRKITTPLQLDSIAVSSYVNDVSSGKLTFRSHPKLNIKNRRILLIDDILDTGNTAKYLIDHLYQQGAEEVKFCVLLDKEINRPRPVENADFTGFKIPNHYVVGYGLDSEEQLRNLPYIGII